MPSDPHPPELYPPLGDETCVYPGCDNPRKRSRKLCYLHAAKADKATRDLNEQERQMGWPSTQFEEGDA